MFSLRGSRLVILIICLIMFATLCCSCSYNSISNENNTQKELINEQNQKLADNSVDTKSSVDTEDSTDIKNSEQSTQYSEDDAINLISDYDKKFIGMWHSPVGISSLYGNRYIFCEDGTYVFFEPEQLENPKIEFGKWNITNKVLTLSPTHKVTELEQVNNEKEFYFKLKKENELKEKTEIKLNVSEITYDSVFKQNTITIDGEDYYQMFDNGNPIIWVSDK